jgi:DNA polymerase III subunit epsilon
MNLHEMHPELVVIDCETTGLNPAMDRIIEIAAVKYRWNQTAYEAVDVYNPLIRYLGTLPTRITEITGITDKLLEESGIAEATAAAQFVKRFVDGWSGKPLFIAYNAPFDIGFFKRFLARHGKAFPTDTAFLDALTVYRDRAPYPHKLVDAIRHYHLSDIVSNSHRAEDDCKATFELLKAMAVEHDDLPLYLNLFGYNPNYPIQHKVDGIVYRPQPFRPKGKLYLQDRGW